MEYNENTRQYHKICRQFKRLLKTYLFGGWDRGALWHLLGAPCINHLTYLLKSKWCNNKRETVITDTFKCIINEWAVPICSDLRDRVNCRMPQSERKRRVTFGWQQVIEAVLRMTNLFKEFILKIITSQFKRFNLAVDKSSIVCSGWASLELDVGLVC